jgi:hypothetical protein
MYSKCMNTDAAAATVHSLHVSKVLLVGRSCETCDTVGTVKLLVHTQQCH